MKSIVLWLVLLFINCCQCCSGCVELDDLSFRKVVKRFKTVLVKFDQIFPYGETHEIFTKFSADINNKSISEYDHDDVLIATVGIKDYGEFDNMALGKKYGRSDLVKFDLPVIKLFNDGNLDNPVDFTVTVGSEKDLKARLYSFLKDYSKARILIPGAILELDDFSEKFVQLPSQREQILKDSEVFTEKIECEEKKKIARTYTALMKGVIEKGENFVELQNERMKKLLKDKLSVKKISELNKKLNILKSFKFTSTNKEEL